MTPQKFIWVTFQRVGFHKYPDALTDPALTDVSYLGSRHRHLFKFKVTIEVLHNNREIEFHQFLNFCESIFDSKVVDIDYKSVEMLADDMQKVISSKYPGRIIKIEVSEDGECGCEITYSA